MNKKQFVYEEKHFPIALRQIKDTQNNETYDLRECCELLNELYGQNKFCEEMAQNLKRKNEQLRLTVSKLDEDNTVYILENRKYREENEQLRKENIALDNENAEHLADNIKELELLEKLTKFLQECDLTDEQRALFKDMITEEDLQPNLEYQTWKCKNE